MSSQNNTSILSSRNETRGHCDLNTYREFFFYTNFLTSTATMGGNLLVIMAYREKRLHITPNFYIESMAVSDMLFPVTNTLRVVFENVPQMFTSEILATVFCSFNSFFFRVSFAVSMLGLLMICVDRFYAVMYPLKARLEQRKTCILTIWFSWLSAAVLYTPELYFTIKASKDSDNLCGNISDHAIKLVFDVLNTTLVYVPFLVTVALYSMIIINLRRRELPGNASSVQNNTRAEQNKKLATMFTFLAAMFTFTWGILWIMVLICRYSDVFVSECTARKALRFAGILPGIYTTFNPLIYFMFCKSFRQGLRNSFYCYTRCLVEKNVQNANTTEEMSYINMCNHSKAEGLHVPKKD